MAAGRKPKKPDFRSKRQFPESASPLLQLYYALLGCLPLVRQKLWGGLLRIRSLMSEASAWMWRFSRKKDSHAVLFVPLAGLIILLAVPAVLYTRAATVTLDGEEVGVVASAEEAEAAVKSVEGTLSKQLEETYRLEENADLTIEVGRTFRSNVGDTETLKENIQEKLHVVEEGYALYINDTFVGATQTQGAYEDLLENVAAPYRNENTVSIDFVEDVSIQPCVLPLEEFTNLSEVALLINSTKAGEVTYTVEQGDTWSQIAQDNNMSNKELLALNGGYDIDRLHVGDVLVISNAVPFLTVVSVQMEYYEAQIPYEVEYVDDDTMYQGDTKIISKGAFGAADTVAKVTYEGNEETEREIIRQTVTLEPVTEVQARGTKERPSWMATGSFRWPCSGSLTSTYGYRYIFGSTSFHGGIDIANKKGTTIVAADGGEVTYAGWMSGYGYLVRIDHLNGYVTYYGHNSELSVSVGDKVYKGQKIAEMGSTGRSTGNHCHFEIRKNGDRVNPLNYLP